jgi:hypothetical protein
MLSMALNRHFPFAVNLKTIQVHLGNHRNIAPPRVQRLGGFLGQDARFQPFPKGTPGLGKIGAVKVSQLRLRRCTSSSLKNGRGSTISAIVNPMKTMRIRSCFKPKNKGL